MPSITALGRERHADLSKFKASLVYKSCRFRTARAVTQSNTVSKKKKQSKNKKYYVYQNI